MTWNDNVLQDLESLFEKLAELPDEASREDFLLEHPDILDPAVVLELAEAVKAEVRVDVQRALRLAETAVTIARKLADADALGRSLRAKANALYMLGRNQAAVEHHEQALRAFEQLGNNFEIAITSSASLQPLILLGEYDRALEASESARKIFTSMKAERRLARLDINTGNIFHRQDRFEEALGCYERAYERLLPHEDAEGIAVVLSNMAVCLISLNDFARALETHERAREFCRERGMPLLAAQADYNIAYLYYLRGEYSRAIEMLQRGRESFKALGDSYHLALCYLDLSEIYVELNLSVEAAETAREGLRQFEQLKMGYEAAKCLVNEAIALSQQGKAFAGLELFAKARAMFVQEKNLVWPWLIDLYQALVLCDEGRFFESRRLCKEALQFFESSILTTKAVLCRLLLARLALKTGDATSAASECRMALDRLAGLEAPALRFQAHYLMGQVRQAVGNPLDAYGSYQKAREILEALRGGLRGEELKIAFLKNRLEVYEGLVALCLERPGQASVEEAFGYMEQAKSRSLTELIVQRRSGLETETAGQSELVKRIRDLREQLNWYYHRIELEQLRPEERTEERLEDLHGQVREREGEFLRALRELPSSQREEAALHVATQLPLETIRASLPGEAMLLEYFSIGDRIVAALLTRESLEILPVAIATRVGKLLRLLQFQLSKFRLGSEYTRAFGDSLLQATQAHLQEIYRELLAPVRKRLEGRHLIVVPHGLLHYLPFHALHDGEKYLIESFTISYAPSATLYSLCHDKQANRQGPSLILGIPDVLAPEILDEVQSVASILPEPRLFIGASAGEEVLRENGPQSRFIHIAAHGEFRRDNPMFSGIRLGGSRLNIYDLYQLKLPAELIALSGCATGLNSVAAGDELMGLVRGLLYAGAQSLLLTLWDVHDRSTAAFMKLFYSHLDQCGDKALALQKAMLQLRESQPHPYYWAPFLLVGKALVAR